MRPWFGQRSAVCGLSVVLLLAAGTAFAQSNAGAMAIRRQLEQQQHMQQQGMSPQMQQQKMQQQMQRANQATQRIAGTIEVVAAGGLQVTNTAGEVWQLHLAPNAQVELHGKATADLLAIGQHVRFVAKVDVRHSKVDEKLGKLTLCTVDQQHPAKAVAEGAGASNALGAAHTPSPAKSAGRTPPPAEETLEIIGRISSLKGNKMTVTVPNAPFKSALRVELVDEPDVEFDLRGADALNMAQRGDKVDAGGFPMANRNAQVTEVKIEAVEAPNATEAKRTPRHGAHPKANASESSTPEAK